MVFVEASLQPLFSGLVLSLVLGKEIRPVCARRTSRKRLLLTPRRELGRIFRVCEYTQLHGARRAMGVLHPAGEKKEGSR